MSVVLKKKKCGSCEYVKDISEFQRYSGKHKVLHNSCKICESRKRREKIQPKHEIIGGGNLG